MVYEKTRWKWHECLQARDEIISVDSECENDDFSLVVSHQQENGPRLKSKQEKLKENASLALVIGAKMARMQVELEREISDKNRSELYELIGINADIHKPLSRDQLEQLNLGQLQIIINDLYCRIEANNDQLINLLIERDSLSMEQDSVLVDIEDLTRRIEERSIESNKQPKEYIYIVKRPQPTLFQKLFSNKFF